MKTSADKVPLCAAAEQLFETLGAFALLFLLAARDFLLVVEEVSCSASAARNTASSARHLTCIHLRQSLFEHCKIISSGF